ncbi:MAG TPA: hydroxyacid dehydrogenase [Bacteroidales bacterium]|nr:hydroxyacid dehydrogenase [Bacteroidales bacterium]HPR74279.1 hydroxyacid dehydrogenase [Bacteroidales bacterium]
MKKILVNEKVSPDALNILKKAGEVVYMPSGDLDEFKKLVKDVTAVMLDTTIKFTPELMDMAPELKVISRTGTGVDNVDVEAATERGIMVLHTPDANTGTVAEHTVALIGAVSKHLLFLDKETRDGKFKTARRLYLPVDLDQKTLGIIGYGRIGKQVAKRCMAAFNMKVIIYDPFIDESVVAPGVVRYDSEEQVYKEADVLTVHVPMTPETKHHIGEKLLSLMKPSAYIINTARGNIVDEAYVIKMLEEDRLKGAAFDVLANEPPVDGEAFLQNDKTIVSPHSAALTSECTVRVACEAATGIVDFLEGRKPRSIFNRKGLNIQ